MNKTDFPSDPNTCSYFKREQKKINIYLEVFSRMERGLNR